MSGSPEIISIPNGGGGGYGDAGLWWITHELSQNQGHLIHEMNDGHRDIVDKTTHLARDICDTRANLLESDHQIHATVLAQGQILARDICDVKHSLTVQGSAQTTLLQAQAAENKHEISRQLSDSFCDLKTQISESASRTNGLISSIEDNNLRQKLEAIKQENLLLKMSCNNNSSC